MFLVVMVVGLAGLAVMALPALGRHSTVAHGVHALRAGHVAKLAPLTPGKALAHGSARPTTLTRFVPSPRLVFSVLALWGAFGNVFVAAHLAVWVAGLLAIVPAALLERFAMTPLWRTLF